MAKKKSGGASKWLYLVFPIAITCLLVFMAFTAYSADLWFFGSANVSLYDLLLNEHLYLAAGVATLVINIIVALYFLAIVFVGDKTRSKLGFLTLLVLIASAISNLVLSIYVCAKLGWNNIAFFGVVAYILWFAIAGISLIVAVCKAYKAFRK